MAAQNLDEKQILEIEPKELNLESHLLWRKILSCSIRLANKSDHHVAFKVMTTAPDKYHVHPKVVGVIEPNSTCTITVIRSQQVAPPDHIYNDKFLIASTIVPKGTQTKHLTPAMFDEEDGKRVQKKKLKVTLFGPAASPGHGQIGQRKEVASMKCMSRFLGLVLSCGTNCGYGSNYVKLKTA